jgi:hypothetical protein
MRRHKFEATTSTPTKARSWMDEFLSTHVNGVILPSRTPATSHQNVAPASHSECPNADLRSSGWHRGFSISCVSSVHVEFAALKA